MTVLAGHPKGGKSTLTFGFLGALEQTANFLGLPVTQTDVVYLSEEDRQTLEQKAKRFRLSRTGVRFLTRREAFPRQTFAEWMRAATECALGVGAGLLVVDTMAFWAALKPDAEKDAGAVGAIVDALMEAASRGLAVLVVHHIRKTGGSNTNALRGSSALGAGVDIIMELTREGGAGHETRRLLEAYSRYDETPDRLVLDLTADGYVSLGAPGAVTSGHRAAIREVLPVAAPGLTQDDICKATGLSQPRVADVLAAGITAEEVDRTGAGKRNDPYRYHRRAS